MSELDLRKSFRHFNLPDSSSFGFKDTELKYLLALLLLANEDENV